MRKTIRRYALVFALGALTAGYSVISSSNPPYDGSIVVFQRPLIVPEVRSEVLLRSWSGNLRQIEVGDILAPEDFLIHREGGGFSISSTSYSSGTMVERLVRLR